MGTASTAVCCCHRCCCAADAEVNLVRAVAATAAVLLLLRLNECSRISGHFLYEQNNEEQKLYMFIKIFKFVRATYYCACFLVLF